MELSHQITSIETINRFTPNSVESVTKADCEFSDGDRNNNAECDLNNFEVDCRKSEDTFGKNHLNIGKTPSSSMINFSVDSILKSSPAKNHIQGSRRIELGTPITDFDYGKIYRPMPVRYTVPFPGYTLNNGPVSLRRCHLKYPFSHYYHHVTPTRTNFDVEQLLSSNPFTHFPYSRNDLRVDPTNPKITSIPPPSATPSSSINSPASNPHTKRKRSWSRAVFSQLQRKGLEIQFQIQKYITKPDRRKLAARLGLTDAQVKVWFQNRRMKWRHTRETKLEKTRSNQNKIITETGDNLERDYLSGSSLDSDSCASSDEDKHEIDVTTE